MLDTGHDELTLVENLIDEAKFEEALEIIKNLENSGELSLRNQLSTLLLKGRIYRYKRQFGDVVEIGEQAYQMSQELEDQSGTIDAILLKANLYTSGEFDKALGLVLQAEEIFNSFENKSSSNFQKQKSRILSTKSWIYFYKGDLESALESAEKRLLLLKKLDNKLEFAYTNLLLGYIYMLQSKYDTALDYAMKSLDLMKELNFRIGISISITLFAQIYLTKGDINQTVKFAEQAYQMNKELADHPGTIEALLLKANILWLGEFDKALEIILEAEKLINLQDDPNPSQKGIILYWKSNAYLVKSELDLALESAEKTLLMAKNWGTKFDIANDYILLGHIYLGLEDFESALDYAKKSLDLMKELNSGTGIASSFSLVGSINLVKGDYGKALNFYKKSQAIKEISNGVRVDNLINIGYIYYCKSEISRSLKYLNQALALARELNASHLIASSLFFLGYVYRIMGEYDKAIESQESSLALSEKYGHNFNIQRTLAQLVLLHLDKGIREQAQQYLIRLEKNTEQKQPPVFSHLYLLAKALVLKVGGRTSNRAESELLLRKILEDDIIHPDIHAYSLGSLCDLYLEDLYLYNNLDLLDDIDRIITQMLSIAEERHSYTYIAATKLLQSKLALIRMNIPEAKKLLVEAQRIAEFHSFDLLVTKISSEHDNLLMQLDVWEDLKKKKAPISERVKLASVDGVINLLQQKRATDPPELVDEQSTLLLIIAEGGVLIFSYSFTEEWKRDDELFSSFLSAFTSFSDEFFSEGLDRVKFGQYTVLLESVNSFSVCYLYKGQTYPAKQKLTVFTERIQNTAPIWQVLEKFYKTSQVLEIEDIPSLESLITDIFITKSPLPHQFN